MSNNHFSIKSRIFKRERVRESEDNLVIVPKTKQTENKNQVEFIWSNNELEQDHLKIVGRVVIKEWERLLTAFPIHRAFIQVRDSGRIHFFVSFEVKNNLTSDEIKKIISTAVSILNECLEKVTKKVFGPEKSRVASIERVPDAAPIKENESSIVNTEREDALIKKLHTEIEQQEILLQKLAKQHENKKEMAVDSTAPVLEPKKDFKNEELVELINKNELLNKKNEELQEKLSKSKKINHELDKVNLKLSSIIEENKVSAARLENVDEIEQRLQELQKENSDYRVQCMESQSLIDQYNNKNDHLNESLEKMKLNQAEMLEQAQADYLNLDENLKESQKKLILETNERQKLEIHIEDVRKKLAESILNNQEKDKEIKGLIIDVKNQEEFNEEKVGEIHKLKSSLDELKAELQMSYATNEVLVEKNTALEAQGEKLKQIDEWQEKYELLQEKYDELGQEAFGYRQEVSLLKSQFNQLEAKLTNVPLEDLEPVSIFEHKTIKNSPVEKVESEEIKETVELVVEKPAEIIEEQHEDSYDDDYEYEDFSYESDPYVEEVVSEELMNIRKVDQVKEEKRIQELLESYKEDTFRDIKVSKEEYRQHVLEFKFLNFRWSQVFIMEDADKNTAFLEWCAPYIEKIETFEEELSFDVKKSFFMKNYVTMDESTFNILKGYSKLSSYLDTYYLKLSFYIDKYFLNEGNR